MDEFESIGASISMSGYEGDTANNKRGPDILSGPLLLLALMRLVERPLVLQRPKIALRVLGSGVFGELALVKFDADTGVRR